MLAFITINCGEKVFFGRSGILPLHFCYFFSQTPSANSATEHGNGVYFSSESRQFRRFLFLRERQNAKRFPLITPSSFEQREKLLGVKPKTKNLKGFPTRPREREIFHLRKLQGNFRETKNFCLLLGNEI